VEMNRGYVIRAGEDPLARRGRIAGEKSRAWVEYNARAASVDRNSARLKELRLQRALSDKEAAVMVAPAPPRARRRGSK
jgi:hypothetical protein